MATGAFVRMRVRSRRKQREQGDSDEVAERRRRPMHFSSTVEPGGVDEENDARDYNFAEPGDDEEQRRENDAPKTQLRKTHRGCEVEHVPRDPEEKGAEQNRSDERRERNGKSACDEGADPHDSQYDAEDSTHRPSLWRCRRGQGPGLSECPRMYLGPGPRGYVVRSSRDCSLAGVGRATIYVHFPTGQSLAAAVTERFEATV